MHWIQRLSRRHEEAFNRIYPHLFFTESAERDCLQQPKFLCTAVLKDAASRYMMKEVIRRHLFVRNSRSTTQYSTFVYATYFRNNFRDRCRQEMIFFLWGNWFSWNENEDKCFLLSINVLSYPVPYLWGQYTWRTKSSDNHKWVTSKLDLNFWLKLEGLWQK